MPNRLLLMLRLPARSFPNALLIWSMLIGCESKKAPTTTETPASATTSRLLPDTAAQASAVDTTVEVAQELPSGDVPAFHEAFEIRKTVVPGLVIVEKSIQQPATAIIHDPWDIKETFSIVRNGLVIYRDTATGMTYDFSEQPEIRKQYPIWIPTGQTDGELLVAFDNRPSKELARRYFIRNNQISKIDTIPAFDSPAKDEDHDGKLEYNGIEDSSEIWDDEQGHRRRAYNPVLYYEIRPAGLVLDSALTERKARADYGVFQGFHYTGTPGVLFSKLPKNSRLRQP